MTVKSAMNLFRDVQVAQEFQQMAAEGYLDMALEVYGTLYVQGGERHYLLSANEGHLIDLWEAQIDNGVAPFPLETLTKTCHVPVGEKEAMLHTLKLELAHKLQHTYPAAFCDLFSRFAETEGDDQAVPLLKKMCKKTVNMFSQDMLTEVEGLARLAYRRKSLFRASYDIFQRWAARERENFADDIIAKDRLQKSWYTLSYLDAAGNIKRLTNARKEWVYHKRIQLEREGRILAPIYAKTYWYNTQTDMDDVRERHIDCCESLMGEVYMKAVAKLVALPSVIDGRAFGEAVATCEAKFGPDATRVFRYYGEVWRVD